MARILVIEDNPDNLELMTYLLKAFGHQTLTACDGEKGIQMAAESPPDLIVCDIHLPHADGYAVAKRLKRNPSLASIPLIAVTALAMVGDRERVLAGGFDGYLTKPIDPQAFVGQLESHLWHSVPSLPPPSPAWQLSAQPGKLRQDGARIVAVDDNPVNRELLRQTLEPSGYQVWLAGEVVEGLVLIWQIRPDLILSDQQMPSQDGFELIRQVKAEPALAAIPVVLLSSSCWGSRDRQAALSLGAARFIERPIEPQRLLDEIAACLQASDEDAYGDRPDR
ncbi:response regulator [Chitinimonas lacunae]|uniref:Response regulator n=1 Tax=Chitinimonas lacunae TaxID=1963018 RepID=A0ABV8MQT0_9NEIS